MRFNQAGAGGLPPARRIAAAGMLAMCAAFLGATTVSAQAPPANQTTSRLAEPARRLPADAVTHHVLDLPGRTLKFTATTGSITLTDANGAPQAQVGVTAFTLDDRPAASRPVTFAFNGGPGAASVWIELGLLGPWRMHMDGDAARPSAEPVPVDNAETWLDFTDLVFIDPVGTGFSQLITNTEEVRKRYWSVNGDVSAFAETIRIWLDTARRMTSPKYLVGESYSGIRAPRLVRELEQVQGIGITGLTLVSPKLDYGGASLALEPLGEVAQLPTIVASMRAKSGPVTRAQLADVEAYAAGDYLVDLIRGEADLAAVARRVDRLAALTGLDRDLLARRHGSLTNNEFFRERDPGRVASAYDTTVTKPDAYPQSLAHFFPDSLNDALSAPFASAMYDIYATRLHWLPGGAYVVTNPAVNRAWDFGNSYYRPESVSALRTALALDPKFHVLVAGGLFDLVTPYFMTKMELDQIPLSGGRDRIRFEVYPGGHMFYSRDESRQAFRAAAQALYGAD